MSHEGSRERGCFVARAQEYVSGETGFTPGQNPCSAFLGEACSKVGADCIWKKAEDDVVDPLGHLAGIYDVLRVRLTLDAFEV